MTQPIRLALIGAGIFARDAHIPAIKSLGDTFRVVAIASRTLDSARARAAELPYPVDVTDDIPGLLARDDIDAVNILLPIDVQPAIIEQALRSGKHVVSEKPIAPDMAAGQALMAQVTPGQVWMVAENWRYEPAYEQAGQVLGRGEIGAPIMASWAMHVPVTPDNKYYQTPWRRSGDFQGGFLLDGGVHHVAGMRLALGEIVQVSAVTQQASPDLPPADTLMATMVFANGCIGTYSVTYAAGVAWSAPLVIAGTQGRISVNRGELEVVRGDTATLRPVEPVASIDAELAAFAAAIRDGAAHRNTPAQGLQDVAVVEAMLRAAATGIAQDVPQVI